MQDESFDSRDDASLPVPVQVGLAAMRARGPSPEAVERLRAGLASATNRVTLPVERVRSGPLFDFATGAITATGTSRVGYSQTGVDCPCIARTARNMMFRSLWPASWGFTGGAAILE